MKKTIIIILIVVFLSGMTYLLLSKDSPKNPAVPQKNVYTEDPTPTFFPRETSNTKTSPVNTTNQSGVINKNNNNVSPTIGLSENDSFTEIKRHLSIGEISEALLLSKNIDNEFVLESWVSYIPENSTQIVDVVEKNNNRDEISNTEYIFSWYIELSGYFENLPTEKQIEISEQFFRLKSL